MLVHAAPRLKPSPRGQYTERVGSPIRKSPAILVLAAFAAFAATDREAAEWVIRKGGRVMVNGGRQPIALLAELPPDPLRITGVDLTGTVLDPKELDHIAGL